MSEGSTASWPNKSQTTMFCRLVSKAFPANLTLSRECLNHTRAKSFLRVLSHCKGGGGGIPWRNYSVTSEVERPQFGIEPTALKITHVATGMSESLDNFPSPFSDDIPGNYE